MADCVLAETCVSLIDGVTELLADKAYDTNAFRADLKARGIKAVIPAKSNRNKRIRYDKEAYTGTQRARALLLPPQRLSAHYHTLRQTRQKLLLRALLRRYPRILDLT